MQDKKIAILIIVITVIFLAGGIFLLTKDSSSPQVTASSNTKVTVDQKTYDWGQIYMKDGNVSKTFVIKNTGSDILKLTKVRTSCHCTKADITINGSTSPSFGMNSISSWIGEVQPASEATMNVVFDPAYHGQGGTGPITRYVLVETNDQKNPTIEFTLTANVVK